MQTIDKLSPWECKYLLEQFDLPHDLKKSLAYRFGKTIYYMCNDRHARSLDITRRTRKGRFYKKDICKCNQSCVNSMLALDAEMLSNLDDFELMLQYNAGLANFCSKELPLNHIVFDKVFHMPEDRTS